MAQVIDLFTKDIIADDPNVAKQSLLEYIENQAFYAMDITKMLPTLPLGDDWGEPEWLNYQETQTRYLTDIRNNLDIYRKAWKKDPASSIETWERIGGTTEFRPEQLVLVKLCQPAEQDEGNVQTIYSEHTPASLLLELIRNLTTVSDQAKAVPPLTASDSDRAIWADNMMICFDQVIRLFDMSIEKVKSAEWGTGGDELIDTFTFVNEEHPEAEDLALIGHNDRQFELMTFSGIDTEELRQLIA